MLSPTELAAFLPETFRLVNAIGRRLPNALLTSALEIKGGPARAALPPILGERGRWLATLNARWQWAAEPLAERETGDPDAADRLWQEGTAAQRRDVLERLRATAPDSARRWLADAWKDEKPDSRLDLLCAMQTGLSAADEPFLEHVLHDRVEKVREQAAAMLLWLPESRLRARIIALADGCLDIDVPARRQGLIRLFGKGRGQAELRVSLPDGDGVDWMELGIGVPPRTEDSTGNGGQLLARLLSRVPPDHWVDRFGAFRPKNLSPPYWMACGAGSCARPGRRRQSRSGLRRGLK